MSAHLDNFEVFPWNPNLETGIEIIDEQHKQLVKLLNQLTGTLVQDDSVQLMKTFDELAAYAKYHFETEEAIWEKSFKDDVWLESHQRTHTSFLPEVLKLKEEHEGESLKVVIELIVKFLIRWLAFHIIDNDKRMAIVLRIMKDGTPLEDAKRQSDEEMSGSARMLIDTVLKMYEGLSSRTLDLMRERIERKVAQEELSKANQKLKEMSVTDQLTGLYNRRHFDDVFSQELRRAKREKRNLSYIMFDIDHFKKLNDYYGHLQGDDALKQVSKTLIEICRRPGDYVFRLGGEEFGVLLADQSEHDGIEFAERIRLSIADLRIANIDSDVVDYLTVSLGVSSKTPNGDTTVDDFLKEADIRLYRAKEQGRNQSISSD